LNHVSNSAALFLHFRDCSRVLSSATSIFPLRCFFPSTGPRPPTPHAIGPYRSRSRVRYRGPRGLAPGRQDGSREPKPAPRSCLGLAASRPCSRLRFHPQELVPWHRSLLRPRHPHPADGAHLRHRLGQVPPIDGKELPTQSHAHPRQAVKTWGTWPRQRRFMATAR
jgi:hypothetical protein